MPLTFTTETTIAAAPERVFAAITDVDGWSRWMHGLVRIDKLTPGSFQPGFTWREVRRMYGREAAEQFEVTNVEAPRRIGLRCDGSKGSAGKGEYVFDYTLLPEGAETRLRLNGEIRLPGAFAQLMGRMMVVVFRKACAKDMAAMKKYLETRGAAVGA
jgi:uncharacterized protein YndB with AHSA1/START domain